MVIVIHRYLFNLCIYFDSYLYYRSYNCGYLFGYIPGNKSFETTHPYVINGDNAKQTSVTSRY